MIARLYRFHGRNTINKVYRNGKTLRGEFISLKYALSNKEDYRLAVVVSRKVSKSAVVRNRIRRRLYEIVRKTRKQSASPWPVDLLISVYDERIASMPHEQLEQNIYKLLQKADIISRSR